MPETPKGLIKLRDGRLVPRRRGWVSPGDRVKCPYGHEMRPALDLHEGAKTEVCHDRAGAVGNARCGALLYVATGAMGRYWFDITEQEDADIKRLGIRPIDVPRFLGIDFPK